MEGEVILSLCRLSTLSFFILVVAFRFSLFTLMLVAVLCPTVLPAAAPVAVDHFPDRMHALIWRNWPVVEARKLAGVLGTTTENVQAVAISMGLPPQGPILAEWKTRGYITVLRRNWHLLPYRTTTHVAGDVGRRIELCALRGRFPGDQARAQTGLSAAALDAS